MKSRAVSLKLGAGAAFYALAACADGRMTLSGTGGAAALEGNPVMRAMMARFGTEGGLWAEKILVGVLCVLIAKFGEREMKRRAPWLDRIPTTKWARAWVRGGDRSWVAYGPLYGTALFQLLAAGSWLWLRAG
ncbi:MAG: hypothetical protein KGL74_00995 [Elusimicrobia bacterium]|nr:hypothetical protein [Elusimicrobiota bacterium]